MQERDGEISKMSSQISDLMMTNEELCRTKVKLEIRAVELEEQKDRWEDEKKELDQNIEQLKTEMKVNSLKHSALATRCSNYLVLFTHLKTRDSQIASFIFFS